MSVIPIPLNNGLPTDTTGNSGSTVPPTAPSRRIIPSHWRTLGQTLAPVLHPEPPTPTPRRTLGPLGAIQHAPLPAGGMRGGLTVTDDAGNSDFWQAASGLAARANRIITGYVTAAGAKGLGDGFTCVRNAIGSYTVTFTPALSTVPIITVTFGAGGAGGTLQLYVSAQSATTFSVFIYNISTGLGIDVDFQFQATST